MLHVPVDPELVALGLEPVSNTTAACVIGFLMQLLGLVILLDLFTIGVELLHGPTPQNQPLGALVQIFANYGLLAMSRNQAHELDIREGLRISTAFQNGADATKNVIGFGGVLVPHINDANIARVLVQDLPQHAVFPIINFIRLLLELGHHYHLLASDGDMQCLLFLVL